MHSPNNFIQIDNSGIRQIDWLDTTGLPRDPSSDWPGIEQHLMPYTLEESGFDTVASYLGLTEPMIDSFDSQTKTYFALLSTAVGNCTIVGPNGEILDPTADQVEALRGYDLDYLHRFSETARQERLRQIAGRSEQKCACV